MSLYASYIRERMGDGIIERPEGFATYRFLNDKKSVYIMDIFVHPDFRKKNIAKELADEIVALAKKEGTTELIGTVMPSAKGSTDSVKVLLAYGMSLKTASNDAIIFSKEI